jgi:hypothetical protein
MAGEAPIYSNSVYNNGVSFDDTDGTDAKVVAYGNTGALVLTAVLLSNRSATAYTFDVFLRRAAVDFQVARVTVAANAGHANGTVAKSLIDPDIIPGVGGEPNTKLVLEASDQLVIQAVAGLGVGDQVDVVVFGGKVT